jgi:hypothetical protein
MRGKSRFAETRYVLPSYCRLNQRIEDGRLQELGAKKDSRAMSSHKYGGEISAALAAHSPGGRTWTATLSCSDARLCPTEYPISSFNSKTAIDNIVKRQVVARKDQTRYRESVFYDD